MNILPRLPVTPLRAVSLKLLGAGALALAVPAALALPLAPAAAQSDRLDQVVEALRGITTMKANFTQTDRGGQSVRGTLTLKRPGRVRFEYEKGVNMLIVANGSRLNLIDYDVNQVESWPIGNSPLGVLYDPNRNVKRYGRVLPTADPDVVSVEVKDAKKPEFGTITLIFTRDASAPGGLELASWVALDAQNKRTTVRLANQRYGMDVANSAFTFRDPRRTSRRPG